nr:hypothetical protein [Tanacetum cinerariifolium]
MVRIILILNPKLTLTPAHYEIRYNIVSIHRCKVNGPVETCFGTFHRYGTNIESILHQNEDYTLWKVVELEAKAAKEQSKKKANEEEPIKQAAKEPAIKKATKKGIKASKTKARKNEAKEVAKAKVDKEQAIKKASKGKKTYELKVTTNVPKKRATIMGNASKSSLSQVSTLLKNQPLKANVPPTKEGNITMSNSYAALNDESEEEIKNMYDESANILNSTKIGRVLSTFTVAVDSQDVMQKQAENEDVNEESEGENDEDEICIAAESENEEMIVKKQRRRKNTGKRRKL